MLTAVGLVAVKTPVSAASPPPLDASYYVLSITNSTAATLGCNQGRADAANGNINSEVILDFGGQSSSNTGTLLTFTNAFASYAAIESYAETFAYNYWACTGTDIASRLILGLGTNNSAYNVSSTGGTSWAAVVNTVINYMKNYGQVTVWGANDMELNYHSYSGTADWESGYAANTVALYVDYGDAAGCPPYGACNNGWTQHDVYLVAWGDASAEAAPEIYYTTQAQEWISIVNAQGYIPFQGPLDEYDLQTSSLTPAGAWTALGCGSTESCRYSMQIQKAS